MCGEELTKEELARLHDYRGLIVVGDKILRMDESPLIEITNDVVVMTPPAKAPKPPDTPIAA